MAHSDYKIRMELPPGDIVAPNGFPADPRPKGAPQVFLDAMEVRIKVFCDEQKCDQTTESGKDEPVSVIRIVPPPHGPHPNGFSDRDEEPYVKLGRVATMVNHRGKGLSRLLTEAAFEWLASHKDEIGPGYKGLILCHAQVSVEKMYAKLGFVTDDKLGLWDEEGIDHIGMWRRV